jgi:hypothetical protein
VVFRNEALSFLDRRQELIAKPLHALLDGDPHGFSLLYGGDPLPRASDID